jgi:hypothetical protein
MFLGGGAGAGAVVFEIFMGTWILFMGTSKSKVMEHFLWSNYKFTRAQFWPKYMG